MQFFLTAWDDTDEGAQDRRMAARPAHLESSEILKTAGHLLYAAAILNDNDQMIGSMEVLDFPSMQEVNDYLDQEPYVVQGVWKKFVVEPCRVGPSFVSTQ